MIFHNGLKLNFSFWMYLAILGKYPIPILLWGWRLSRDLWQIAFCTIFKLNTNRCLEKKNILKHLERLLTANQIFDDCLRLMWNNELKRFNANFVTSTSVFRKWISISVTLKISSIITILQNYFFFANDETKMKELNILLKPSVMTFSGGLKSAKMK